MSRQNVPGITRIVRFIDCIGENIHYFEVKDTGNDTQDEKAAVDRFQKTIGHDPYECCGHCGDRLYSSYFFDDDEAIPYQSTGDFFPLE